MATANVERMKAYLRAVEAMGKAETVEEFFAPEATVQEFPNRIAPQGRVRQRGGVARRVGAGAEDPEVAEISSATRD